MNIQRLIKGILLSTLKPQSRANNTIFRPDKALNTSLYELTKVQTECLPANCQTINYIAKDKLHQNNIIQLTFSKKKYF